MARRLLGRPDMHARSIGAAVLAAVAAVAAGSSIAACTSCPETNVVRDDRKDVPTSIACATLNGTSRNAVCADLCDTSYNNCFVDTPYIQTWSNAVSAASADGGSPTTVCPAPDDGRTVVTVRCRETEQTSELKPGGTCAHVVEGRRSDNLIAPPELEDLSCLGSYFASIAHLEAAAVLAFERMIEELRVHGAPLELIDEARRAREDEIRHARVTTRLAHRFGATPPEAQCARATVRGLFAIALENEVEGVVRETLGAALATWRSEHANDADIRSVMTIIARDERRHAELSWALAAWVRPRLTVEERTQLDDARREAVKELRLAFTQDPASDVMEVAGVPKAEAVQSLLDELERNAWATAAA